MAFKQCRFKKEICLENFLNSGKQGKCGHTRKFCLSSGQIVPRNLVASQGLTLLFLVSAICRVSKQVVNVCFHGYKATKYSRKYLAEHSAELSNFRAAQATMREILNGEKLLPMEALKEKRHKLVADKKRLYAEYRQAQNDMREAIVCWISRELIGQKKP